MDPFITGSLILGGSSLLGGLMGMKSASDALESQEGQNFLQMQLQKEFAQKGIRWKAIDAKKAGLHPLAALGANTISYTPQMIGGGNVDLSMANAVRSMGQDIGRAFMAKQTELQRDLANIQIQKELAQLENMKLQNVGLARKISEGNTTPTLPTFPDARHAYLGIPGQPNGNAKGVKGIPPGVEFENSKIPYSQSIGVQAGMSPAERFATFSDGTAILVPSQSIEEAIENPATAAQYAVIKSSKYVRGLFQSGNPKFIDELKKERPKSPDPRYEWRYDIFTMGWREVKREKGETRLFLVTPNELKGQAKAWGKKKVKNFIRKHIYEKKAPSAEYWRR